MRNFNKIKPEIQEAIVENDTDYFDDCPYSDADKVKFLENSIASGKVQMIKYFMEQGLEVKNDWCYHSLMDRKIKPLILEYLESKGVNLRMGNDVLFFKASLHNNIKFVDYLAKKMDTNDQRIIHLTILNVANEFEKNLSEVEGILKILLPKATSETINNITGRLTGANKENNKKFLLHHFLEANLETSDKLGVKIKI